MTPARVAQRLPRLLSLVPYLLARPGVSVSEAAAAFGVSEVQLRRDLELLWMCGLPGYGPGDLVDLSFDGDSVTVTFDAGMRRPLRLTTAEGSALAVALLALAEAPGHLDAGAARRALAKIEAAAGAVGQVDVAAGLSEREETRTAAMREALEARQAVRIVYYSASRDAVGQRVVDPMRLLVVAGHGYLEAWCRQAEGVRLFRLDRVERFEVLDEPAVPPPHAEPADVSEGLFRAAPGQEVAVLELAAQARWVAEYYPVEAETERSDGAAEVRMRYADQAWMVRLLLGLGGDARVLAPPSLVAAVADHARLALERNLARHSTSI